VDFEAETVPDTFVCLCLSIEMPLWWLEIRGYSAYPGVLGHISLSLNKS
jgi:hypothetical protein